MMKITLTCGTNTINTTCEGVSQHIWNRCVVHRISNRGLEWFKALQDDHETVFTTTKHGCHPLDYLSFDPIP